MIHWKVYDETIQRHIDLYFFATFAPENALIRVFDVWEVSYTHTTILLAYSARKLWCNNAYVLSFIQHIQANMILQNKFTNNDLFAIQKQHIHIN